MGTISKKKKEKEREKKERHLGIYRSTQTRGLFLSLMGVMGRMEPGLNESLRKGGSGLYPVTPAPSSLL